jgi:hypothetical protein
VGILLLRTIAGVAVGPCLAGANLRAAQTTARSQPGQLRAPVAEKDRAEQSSDEPSHTESYAEQHPAREGHKPNLLGDPSQSDVYTPITSKGRMQWVVVGTIGPRSLAAGIFTSAYSTALNNPHEYGPGWEGFGRRYGMRLTGIATGNLMEAGMGSMWGEDPRYFRAPEESFGKRVKHVIKLTFATRRRDGAYGPAYARFIAVPGNNFLSNTWRADSESRARDALIRTVEGFLGQMAGNAFGEFWPDVSSRIFHPHH